MKNPRFLGFSSCLDCPFLLRLCRGVSDGLHLRSGAGDGHILSARRTGSVPEPAARPGLVPQSQTVEAEVSAVEARGQTIAQPRRRRDQEPREMARGGRAVTPTAATVRGGT